MNATITLSEYLNKKKTFVIPGYQRGYIWGRNRRNEKDSVTHLLGTILNGFQFNTEVFLQGVTVSEQSDKTVIIDGQQRTTCLFLLLKYLGYEAPFVIRYEIRDESNCFLQNLDLDDIQEKEEEFQDIYFFKKSLRIIKVQIAQIDKAKLREYVLHKIKFLYINIPDSQQAMKVFTMMNGNKAQMKQEEIIKAEMLRLASLGVDTENLNSTVFYANEWDNKMLRSRYAREWDKWLYWWGHKDVQKLFRCSDAMGLLISTYSNTSDVKFELFKEHFLKENIAAKAKQTFDGLRRLQKRFEDGYNNPIVYNKIGAILRIFNPENRLKFFEYYFNKDHKSNLDQYYRLVFLDMTHEEIIDHIENKNTDVYDVKYKKMLSAISNDEAYIITRNEDNVDCKEWVSRLLLRLNIDENCKQNQQDQVPGRKFDFSIWISGNRSLEHIYPKSKVVHKDGDNHDVDGNGALVTVDNTFIHRDDIKWEQTQTTEHSIGNLVLLYKNDNSAFSNSLPERKKAILFNPTNREYFNSRHLLHTIYIFAKSQWNAVDIAKAKIEIVTNFKNYYGKQD